MSPTQKMKTFRLPVALDSAYGQCPGSTLGALSRTSCSTELQPAEGAYLGKWYEIAKLPAQFEKGSCIEANYSIRADGTIKVYNSEILKGKLRSIEGTAVVQDINEPAKLAVSFSYAVTPYTPYWVLSTDYEHSALVYSCTDVLRLFHFDFAWILSRMRSLPPETIQKAKDLFTNSSIDISKMIMTQQQGCDPEL
ncbi:apolipoprotein D-like [Scleropages formosus]|uniref:Apolipoprotein D n=1 Tax=Scleropages formosus TaxID=113540 RepID=A0A0P7V828_SCLFO|nr:apolipoprotein D-like [Scleropages formosus]